MARSLSRKSSRFSRTDLITEDHVLAALTQYLRAISAVNDDEYIESINSQEGGYLVTYVKDDHE
jgi:hypothetical protein